MLLSLRRPRGGRSVRRRGSQENISHHAAHGRITRVGDVKQKQRVDAIPGRLLHFGKDHCVHEP